MHVRAEGCIIMQTHPKLLLQKICMGLPRRAYMMQAHRAEERTDATSFEAVGKLQHGPSSGCYRDLENIMRECTGA